MYVYNIGMYIWFVSFIRERAMLNTRALGTRVTIQVGHIIG